MLLYLLRQYFFQVVWREQPSVKQQVPTFLQTLTSQNQQLMGRLTGQQIQHLQANQAERLFILQYRFIPS